MLEDMKRKCLDCGKYLDEDDEICFWCESEDFEWIDESQDEND